MPDNIKLFEDREIRTSWNENEEDWYFSVNDVVEVLTDTVDVKQYVKKLRNRDKELNSKWGTICTPVQMTAKDGKQRKINAANTAGILRIIQSIPSKKAEPFKIWLARVGAERLNEIADPELTIQRALSTYRKKGYSESWINQRLKTIEIRKELTDEWDRSGVEKGIEYAILTDEISKAWSGMTTREYKNFKGLKKENLRDNMSNMELVLNMLAEVSTTEISRSENPKDFNHSKSIAERGGNVAKEARKNIETQTGKPAITSQNAAELNEVVVRSIEDISNKNE